MQNKIETGRQLLRSISVQDFLAFGLNQIVYIRPVSVMGHTAYSLHGADGSTLAVSENLAGAVNTARQNDLEPVTLQ